MKKRSIILITFITIAAFQMNSIFAKSFEGREDEMNKKCSAVYDNATLSECQQYKEYLIGKNQNLDKEIASIKGQVASIEGDVSKISALIDKNNKTITEYDNVIGSLQASIDTIQVSITTLQEQIDEKQASVNERDELMKKRIVEMQAYIGSNNYIDFIMGSSSFADLMRRSQIVAELSSYENEQIELISLEKKKMNEDKQVIEEQKALLFVQQTEANNNKQKAEALNIVNKDLIATYHAEQADLNAQKIEAQMAQASIKESLPNISTTIPPELDVGGNPDDGSGPGDGGNDGGSSGSGASNYLMAPLQSGWHYESGTWSYPGGGVHLGMDFSTGRSVNLPVVAPASGIVLSSYSGCAQYGGLGVGCGIPWGGGNNVLLAVQLADGSSYVMPFYHLTSPTVSPGQVVQQGQVIGYSGSSGNSSGPHCHVEVINVGGKSLEQIITTWNYNKDYTFGTGWSSPNACGSAPCRLRPENFWL